MSRIGILFQDHDPPARGGIRKPRKPTGGADSGADLAYTLQQLGLPIITPVTNPSVDNDRDWVFSDTPEGIQKAVNPPYNVETIWLNTVLYSGHPIEKCLQEHPNIRIIGQHPTQVDSWDDKIWANEQIRQAGLPVPDSYVIHQKDMNTLFTKQETDNTMIPAENSPLHAFANPVPFVLKPIRGRGSQGVSLVYNFNELYQKLQTMFNEKVYGDAVYIEKYLQGKEITVTVMPPGTYVLPHNSPLFSFDYIQRIIADVKRENYSDILQTVFSKSPQFIDNIDKYRVITFTDYWALPPVHRFAHENGIAPYNGKVAVSLNSHAISIEQWRQSNYQDVSRHCEIAARLTKASAPIRIDCRARQDENDDFAPFDLFDLNMKPNMTVASRPHRLEQASLSALAGEAIGWDYSLLVVNLISQQWGGQVPSTAH